MHLQNNTTTFFLWFYPSDQPSPTFFPGCCPSGQLSFVPFPGSPPNLSIPTTTSTTYSHPFLLGTFSERRAIQNQICKLFLCLRSYSRHIAVCLIGLHISVLPGKRMREPGLLWRLPRSVTRTRWPSWEAKWGMSRWNRMPSSPIYQSSTPLSGRRSSRLWRV